MIELDTVLYTARVHTSGGRDGTSRSSDGRLDVKLSTPGSTGSGTNPEQLLASGWSASLLSAIKAEADRMQVRFEAAPTIDAEVDLGIGGGASALAVRMAVCLPGVERGIAQRIVEVVCQSCPYCRATRGNIRVVITLD